MESSVSPQTPAKNPLPPLAMAGILFTVLVVCIVGNIGVIFVKNKLNAKKPPVPPAASPEAAADGGVSTGEGDAGTKFEAPPTWVPVYEKTLKPARASRWDDGGVTKGTVALETSDGIVDVREFFEGKLKAAGFDLTIDKTAMRDFEQVEITARKNDGKQTMRTVIHQTGEKTDVTSTYTDAETSDANPAEKTAATPPPSRSEN